MKMIDRLMVVLMIVAMPVSAMAQNNMEKAISKFVNGKAAKSIITGEFESIANNPEDTLFTKYNKYTFTVKKNSKEFKKLHKAFLDNRGKAYNVYTKKAGMTANETRRVGYGSNGEKILEFGTFKERNYIVLLIRAPKNAKRRTAYALVWYDNPSGKNMIEGSLHIVSGQDPQKTGKSVMATTTISNLSSTIKILNDGTVIKTNKDGTEIIYDKTNNSITRKTTKIDGDDKNEPTSASEFMQKFGTYRSLYINIAEEHKEEYRTSIINKMLDLCKNYSSLLTKDEAEVCILGVKKMQKLTSDEYQNGLLSLAVKALNKSIEKNYHK